MPHGLTSGLPKDYLRSCLLLLLREGEAHGYELIESVAVFGFDTSDPGALYRGLRRLESDGLVRSDWQPSGAGPPRRIYELTDAGVAELDQRAGQLAEAARRVDGFLDRYLKARRLPKSSPKRRAMVGRITAHRAAADGREPLAPRAPSAVPPTR